MKTSVILMGAAIAAASSCGAGEYVADPYRSVDVVWAKHDIKGRDYWLMIQPNFLGLKGLENEPFVVDSGTAFVRVEAKARRANPWGFPGPNDFYTIGGIINYDKIKDRLSRAPFEVFIPVEESSGLRLSEKNFDYSGYEALIRDYPETFLGVRFNEWDAGVLHRLHRYTSPGFLRYQEMAKIPCNRAEMRENFHKVWQQAQVRAGRRMFGLSGIVSFEHWGCEWGGSVSCVEVGGECTEYPLRNCIMFARSAARQFNVPMCIYTAYYRAQYHPDSRPDHYGPEAGRETSLAWREHMLAYYMGNNLQNVESQPYGQCRKLEDGTHVLTPNGLEMRRLYEWTRSSKGARGECYTPILFLLDRAHGYDQLSSFGIDDDCGAYKGTYPPSDADFYTEYAMKSICPRYNYYRHAEQIPDKSANIRNSPYGDIFDVFIANSDVPGRELRDDQLARYAVVMALGDILWSNELANKVRRYVAEGGTFVVTAGQVAPFAKDAKFLGEKFVSGKYGKDDVLVNSYGNGRVVLVANPFMHQDKEPWKVPQSMKELLAKLQDEVVPFKISGDCEFLYNRMPDGSWKAIVMNNAGTAKKGLEKNPPFDPKWTREATIELPADAEAEEVLEGIVPRVEKKGGVKRLVYAIPSGCIIVVNVKGVKTPSPKAKKPFDFKEDKSFADMVYKPHPVWDKYLKNPADHAYLDSPPTVVFDWKNPTGGAKAATTNAVVKMKYTMPMCTFDVEAKANPGGKPGVLFYISGRYGVKIDSEGRWACFVRQNYLNVFHSGPKATGDWQKIRLTFDRGEIRFYVDGVECLDPEKGPFVTGDRECRDGFYEQMRIDVGEAEHGWGEYFDGVIKSLKISPWAGREVKLWPEGKTPDFQANQTEPFFVWCEPKERKSDMVVIAISGGGYHRCGIGGFEVLPVRDYFLDKGVTVATLLYRTPRPEGLPFNLTAWQDAQRAVRLVRREARKRGLNPENIGFTGGSAGGNLTMLAAISSQTQTYAPIDDVDNEPCHVNWAVPIYQAHALVGTENLPGKEDANDFTIPFADYMKFDAKTPPLCLFVGDADTWSPHSVRVWQKLHQMKIPVELHVLAKGGHCFQMPSRIKRGTLSETWKDVFWQWLVRMDFVK